MTMQRMSYDRSDKRTQVTEVTQSSRPSFLAQCRCGAWQVSLLFSVVFFPLAAWVEEPQRTQKCPEHRQHCDVKCFLPLSCGHLF